MQATLAELAALVDGELVGDGELVVTAAAPLGQAGPGSITMVDRVERIQSLRQSGATAAIAPRSFVPNGTPVIRVDNVHRAFTTVVTRFRPPRSAQRVGISPQAVVSPTAKIGRDVEIHPLATIGDDVEIGDGTTIHSGVHIAAGAKIGCDVTIFPGTVLYENTVVGARCVIHANVVLGAYGFGYCCVDGKHQLTAQLGHVVLEDDVEVGACTTIDRGTYGPTVVGEGTKIDNQVMIGHNCRVGRHNMLCAQVGIAGSTSTGDYVVLGGQVGVRDHVHIGDRTAIGAKGGVACNIPEDSRMIGAPVYPEREFWVQQAALAKLPELRRQFKKLQHTVDKMLRQAGTESNTAADAANPTAP